MKKNIFYTILAAIVTLPSVLFAVVEGAGDGVVACTGTNCDFKAFMITFERVFFFFVGAAFLFLVVAFVWAGFLYLTSAGDSGKIKQANTIFKNVIIGVLFVLLAYTLVDLLLGTLGFDKAFKINLSN